MVLQNVTKLVTEKKNKTNALFEKAQIIGSFYLLK